MSAVERVAADRLRAVPAIAAAVRRRPNESDEGRKQPPAPRNRVPRPESEAERGTDGAHVDIVA